MSRPNRGTFVPRGRASGAHPPPGSAPIRKEGSTLSLRLSLVLLGLLPLAAMALAAAPAGQAPAGSNAAQPAAATPKTGGGSGHAAHAAAAGGEAFPYPVSEK